MAEVIDKAHEEIAEELKKKLIYKAKILLKRKESLFKELNKIDDDLAILDSGKDVDISGNLSTPNLAFNTGAISVGGVFAPSYK